MLEVRPIPKTRQAIPSMFDVPPSSNPSLQRMARLWKPTPSMNLDELTSAFDRLEQGTSVVLSDGDDGIPQPPDEPGPWLGVWSSGSTRKPRCSWHRWNELRSHAVPDERVRGWTLATPYRAASFAGVQVALQAWLSRGRCLPLRGDWSAVWAELEKAQPEALCCTPTFLELLRATEDRRCTPATWNPRQITLGGEPVRPNLGLWIRTRFPETGFTAVYASTELGIIAKSHRLDGWYEVGDLQRRCEGWRIVDRQLAIRRNGEWANTGDRIEVDAGQRHFRVLGRLTAVANVAGTKVSLAEIESMAVEVPGVFSAFARAEFSVVVGQIVALRYALVPGATADTVQPVLEHHLRRGLPKEAWPRRWECASPELGPNAKRRA